MITWVLGRRDSPSDALEDYCRYLGAALNERGVASALVRVLWDETGWIRALGHLWQGAAIRKGDWTLVQYTALGWSRRGFPLPVLVAISLLRIRKTRLAVVFHDPEPYGGKRRVDRLRRACQLFVMRSAYRLSEASIFCAPLESISWLPSKPAKATFIPVGANIPPVARGPGVPPVKDHGQEPVLSEAKDRHATAGGTGVSPLKDHGQDGDATACGPGVSPVKDHGQDGHATACGTGLPPVKDHGQDGHATARTITVFAITDGGDISKEVSDIVFAAKAAAARLPRIRLVTIGRGSLESEPRFRKALDGSTVEYSALGVLPSEKVSQMLASSDVSLFVRGPVSTQRGSAIASIACGVPLVAYAGSSLPVLLAEAGVVGVPCGDREKLAEATSRVLTDDQLRCDLHERSRRAHQAYFSWEAVASRFAEVLGHA